MVCLTPEVRRAAADDTTLESVLDDLVSGDPERGRRASGVLARIGAGVLPRLVEIVRDGPPERVRAALAVIVGLGDTAAPAYEGLMDVALHATPERRAQIGAALLAACPEAVRRLVPGLVEGSRSPDAALRAASLRALVPLAPVAEDAAAEIAEGPEGIDGEERALRRVVAFQLGNEDADRLVRSAPDPNDARAWTWWFADWRKARSAAVVAERLGDPDSRRRVAAADELRALGELAVDAVPALTKAVRDPQRTVRLAAIAALAEIGSDAAAALPALGELAADDASGCQLEAIDAIGAVIWRRNPAAGPAARLGTWGSPEDAPPRVAAAIDWLVRHQSPDGRWSCAGFGARCRGSRCNGAGDAAMDAGVTALAARALLAGGVRPDRGRHAQALHEALGWLRASQDEDGCIGGRIHQRAIYGHLAATLALAETCLVAPTPSLRRAVQRATRWIHWAQNPRVAWRYGIRDGDNDTDATCWAVLALRSVADAGVAVDPGAFDCASDWLASMTDPETGRVGYQARGGHPARYGGLVHAFPGRLSESTTAAGLVIRASDPSRPGAAEMSAKGAALLAACPPRWNAEEGVLDFVYWHHGTVALVTEDFPAARAWLAAARTALETGQRTADSSEASDDRGSWDAADAWSPAGGRVYATAINALTLAWLCRALDAPPGDEPDGNTMPEPVRAAVRGLETAAKSRVPRVRTAAGAMLARVRTRYR